MGSKAVAGGEGKAQGPGEETDLMVTSVRKHYCTCSATNNYNP